MKFLKKIVVSLIVLLLFFQLSNASSNISIKVNGKYLSPDVPPFITNSSTYVPIRFVSEALNIKNIKWDAESGSVTIKSADKTLVLFVNKNYAYINNEYTRLENNALISNSRTFVPVRFISECFNAYVDWDDSTQTVLINSNKTTSSSKPSNSTNTKPSSSSSNNTVASAPSNSASQTSNYNDAVYWLSRIIEAEASGEPFKGKVAVGEVILNRVKCEEFPNTIWGVIFDKNFGIQFEPVANGTIYNTPSEDSILAAKTALNGSDYVGECLYFLNPTIAKSTWITKNREYYTTISKHEFYI